jgi:HSF-type DNA-binding
LPLTSLEVEQQKTFFKICYRRTTRKLNKKIFSMENPADLDCPCSEDSIRFGGNQVRLRQGGITQTFPKKLYSMLKEIGTNGLHSDIIHWNKVGNSIVIQRPKEFTEAVLPIYFRTNKFSSFQRQLNAYGFTRFNLNSCQKDIYIYYHKAFHRDHPARLQVIRRRRSLYLEAEITPTIQNRRKKLESNILASKHTQPLLQVPFINPGDSKDLILDEAAAAISFDEGGKLSHKLSDLLRFWNPDREILLSDSDDDFSL